MARSYNRAILVGNVGRDPELRYTSGGKAVAAFSLATSEQWKDQDGNKQERTDWHNIVAWGKTAEVVGEYVKKGAHLLIEGRIQTRSYDDKNTGAKKYVVEIVADRILMLDKRSDSNGGRVSGAATSEQSSPAPAAGATDEPLFPDTDPPF